MNATGIVAEYNPFHNGHVYHLAKARQLTQQPVIVVMSGSFMQRGEPAVLDKWQRAQLAMQGGADLVLELPCAFTLRSAEFFARGAVQLLAATGCCNTLCCGAETATADFAELARRATSSETQTKLRTLLKDGASYASAACEALGSSYALTAPNDILALEYTKALSGTGITPLYVQRQDAGYNSAAIAGASASATAIRQALSQGNVSWQQAVPPYVRAALLSAGYDQQLLWQLIAYRLRLLTPAQIAARCEASEGLENLLKQAASCTSLAEAAAHCTHKRYTTSRARRLLMQILLDKPRSTWQQQCPAYLRVLAFGSTGRQLLKQMKRTSTLPVITKLGKNAANGQSNAFAAQLELELAATDVWSLLAKGSTPKRAGNDYYTSPVYFDEIN